MTRSTRSFISAFRSPRPACSSAGTAIGPKRISSFEACSRWAKRCESRCWIKAATRSGWQSNAGRPPVTLSRARYAVGCMCCHSLRTGRVLVLGFVARFLTQDLFPLTIQFGAEALKEDFAFGVAGDFNGAVVSLNEAEFAAMDLHPVNHVADAFVFRMGLEQFLHVVGLLNALRDLGEPWWIVARDVAQAR